MEQILKIFTLTGSCLGAIAFFQNLTKEMVSANKDKWKKITEIIKPVDFDNLRHEIENGMLRGETLNKLEELVYNIDKNDLDTVGFKSVFGNRIKNRLHKIAGLHKELRTYVQVPYWNPKFDVYDDDDSAIGYKLDKNVFFMKNQLLVEKKSSNEIDRMYDNHLKNVETIAIKMYIIFSEIQKLSNKESFEFLLPWKWKIK